MFMCSCASLPKEDMSLNDPHKKEWVQLFNGVDLTGWDIKIRRHELNDNYLNTFQVRDGAITVVYDEYQEYNQTFGHIFYKEPFSYYLLKAEYRFIGEQCTGGPGWAFRNNGLMLHSQSAASMGLDQDFPVSIEVQLLGGSGEGERSTMNLCTPGTHVYMDGKLHTAHCTNSSSKTYHGDQWVMAEVLVEGNERFTHIVNGDTVMTYTQPLVGGGVVGGFDAEQKIDGTLLSAGHIALQAESHPTQFRKIELLNLEGCMDPKARNYKSYYRKDKKEDCRY